MRLTPRTLFRFVAPKQGQPMAYPYTFAAKWSQWNIIYELRNNYILRFTVYGFIAVFPAVWFIHRAVNSPANKAAFKKAKQLEHEKEHDLKMWADISGRNANR